MCLKMLGDLIISGLTISIFPSYMAAVCWTLLYDTIYAHQVLPWCTNAITVSNNHNYD